MKILSSFFYLLLFLLATASGAVAQDNAITSFVGGNNAYRQGDYAEAVAKYQEVLATGRASGELYYNLANSYYRNKELGWALLNYERARLYIPRDSDVRYNRRYTLRRLNVAPPLGGANALQSRWRDFLHYYTFNEMTVLAFLCLLAAGMIFLAGSYRRWPSSRTKGLTMVFVALALGYAAALTWKVNLIKDLAIAVKPAEALFEPREGATAHYGIKEGESVRIVRSQYGWHKVQREDGELGWIRHESIRRVMDQEAAGP